MSDGQSAYQRYYAKNREQILARMRERAATKREERRQAARQSAEALNDYRECLRDKYHRGIESKTTKQLKLWMDDPGIAKEFKQFLKACVWEHKSRLSPAFVRGLGRLSIADAFPDRTLNPIHPADGEASGDEA